MTNKESLLYSSTEKNNEDLLKDSFTSGETFYRESALNGRSKEQQKKKSSHSKLQSVGNMKFPLLAIDGGGTKTIAVITDSKGKVLSCGKSGTSNYQVSGKNNAVNILKHVIREAIDGLHENVSHCDTKIIFNVGVFALAGIDTQKDKTIIQEIVRQVIDQSSIQINKVMVENDALSVLLGVTNRTPGVILISGTGSIAFAHDGEGLYVRAGGWGHRLGDEGGGYWIGKQAIRSILKMLDGRGPKTVMSELVLNHLQLEDHEQLYNWVYGSDYSIQNVGELSAIVEQANHLGDSVAKSILDRAVVELYRLVTAVIKRAGISDGPLKLLFLGGVLQNSKYINSELIYRTKAEMSNVDIITNHQKPIELIIQRGLEG